MEDSTRGVAGAASKELVLINGLQFVVKLSVLFRAMRLFVYGACPSLQIRRDTSPVMDTQRHYPTVSRFYVFNGFLNFPVAFQRRSCSIWSKEPTRFSLYSSTKIQIVLAICESFSELAFFQIPNPRHFFSIEFF